MSDGGKGSKPRPLSISKQEYDMRWNTIFGRDRKDDIEDKAKRERALDEMVRINQELGLYDECSNSNANNRK